MSSITDAVRTVEAMAEIPCLRGGFACFDDQLEPQRWHESDAEVGTVWARIPDQTGTQAAREAVEAGIAGRRRWIEDMIEFARTCDLADEEQREEFVRLYCDELACFLAAAGCGGGGASGASALLERSLFPESGIFGRGPEAVA